MSRDAKKILKKLTFLVFFSSLVLILVASFFTEVRGQSSDNIEGTIRVAICGNDEKEPLEQCDGPDFNSKTCATLGFDSGDLSCRPSCQFLTTDCDSEAVTYDEEVFNKTVGGELSLINPDTTEGTIEVPVSAFSTNLSLFAFSFTSDQVSVEMPAPSGKSFVGHVYDFKFFDESVNEVSSFLESATLTITYLDADFSGLEESEIQPYHYNEDDSEWYLIPDSTLQQGINSINFETTSFSNFALFSSEPSDDNGNDNDNGNGNGGGSSGGGGGGWGGGNNNQFRNNFERGVDVPASVDFNNDSQIDVTDLSILLYYWEKIGPEITAYDLNGDGVIDIVDASILFYHWTS